MLQSRAATCNSFKKYLQSLQKVEPSSTASVKLGLQVVTIAEHACDHVLNRFLKLSACQFQILLVKYEYLRSIQLCEDQGILGKLKKRVLQHVLAIVTTYMETRLYSVQFSLHVVLQWCCKTSCR